MRNNAIRRVLALVGDADHQLAVCARIPGGLMRQRAKAMIAPDHPAILSQGERLLNELDRRQRLTTSRIASTSRSSASSMPVVCCGIVVIHESPARPQCANTGHSTSGWRTPQIDPLLRVNRKTIKSKAGQRHPGGGPQRSQLRERALSCSAR
jgi:hypothetical protein